MEELVKNWYEAKEAIAKLEEKIKDYKIQAGLLMKTKDWKGKEYMLEIKEMKRRTISKNDIAEHIWEKFSKENTYDCYYVTKIGEKKNRSMRRSVNKKK